MADKPIKLTDAQLTTLQQVADPNYTLLSYRDHSNTSNWNIATLRALGKKGVVNLEPPHIKYPSKVFLSDKGRAYLDSLGIAPIPLAPPPKTDKERIAELEAALWKTYADINCYFALEDISLTEARDVLVEIEGYCQQALGIEE